MDYAEYLRRLPKVELHCHVEGTLRPQTVADLASRHDIALPTTDVDRIYDYETIYEFLEIFRLVNSTVIDQGDFARIAYESLEDGVQLGNLKYREMFFNPTLHTTRGVAMSTIIDGLIDGCRAAEQDLGVRCRLIADVYRQDPPAMALQMTEEVIANRRDELIGLGMDAAEAPDPPEKFFESFRTAGEAGLHLTSHSAEDGPPKNISTCLDLLGCERIDHGYHILEDDAVVERCREDGIHFTCCPTSTAVVYGWPDLTTHPINAMMKAGLLVHLNSDDPTMFRTDIGKEYVDFVGQNEYPPEIAKQLVRNGVDATWLDPSEKAALHQAFDDEIAALDKELAAVTDGAIGMLSNTDAALRRAWHPVARSNEITAVPRPTRLLGEDWVVVRLPDGGGGETLAAFVDRCPHRLAPLSAGSVDGSFLRCGYHGWCFDAVGACREIPSLGASEHVPPRAVATVPAAIAERHGMVFIAPEPPLTELLDIPEADDPAFVHGAIEPVTARVGAGLMIDNFLDMAHFPFVHAATIGTPESATFELDVVRDGLGMKVHSRHPFPNREDPGVAAGIRPLLQERVLEYRYRAPFSICLRIDYVEAGGTNVLDFYVQPESDESCRVYTTVHRNDLEGDEVQGRMAECVAFERKILDEDLGLQEQYRDRRLPLDLTAEVHVKADRPTIELRRILGELVRAAAV